VRDGRGSRGPRREPAAGNATYWVGVGHNDRVKPGHLVGALANEVGLPGNAIGAIDLRGNHALVELPKDLTPEQLEAGARAEVNGRPLGLRLDTGRPTRAERAEGNDDGPRRRHDGPHGGRGRQDRFDRGDRGGRVDRAERDERRGRGERVEGNDDGRHPSARRNREDNHTGKKPRWGGDRRRERGVGDGRGGRGRGDDSWGRNDVRRGGGDRGKRGGSRGKFGPDKDGRGGFGGGKGGRGSGPKRFGRRPQR